MRILHVATDDLAGGAGRCAYRLHLGLRDLGQESEMLVRRRRSEDASVRSARSDPRPLARARRRARRWWSRRGRHEDRPSWTESYSDGRSWLGVSWRRHLRDLDVVNLHRVEGLIDYQRFFGIVPPTLPIVWTMHDMNAFTGGCPYDLGCGRFRERCGRCPQLGSERARDASRATWLRKEKLFGALPAERLHVVTPSRWLAGEVRSSSLFGDRFEVSVIPYGVDTEAYAPRERAAARRTLGLPRDVPVLLFVAHSLDNRRKGGGLLPEALPRVVRRVPELHLLVLGKRAEALTTDRVPTVAVGYTSDDRLLSLVYSAADLLVLPSLQDNLPATALEALACGLPIVGFEVGGIPDMIRPGRTGVLAPAGDAEALGEAIVRALEDDSARAALSHECRRIALDEYPLELQARRYLELYSGLGNRGVRMDRASAAATAREPREAEEAPEARVS